MKSFNSVTNFGGAVCLPGDVVFGAGGGVLFIPSHLVADVVEGWAKNPDAEDITVILNTEDVNALEEAALASLKDKISKGITLKANDNFDGGFRISVNNGAAYYDYSAEAVVDMMSNYLSPKVTKLLKEAE